MRSLLAAVALVALGAGAAHAAPVALAPVAIDAKLQDRFAKDYGAREIEVIEDLIQSSVSTRLTQSGATLSADAPTRIEITLVDVKPSRPTFQQAVDKPGLDIMRSVSLGGATLKARIVGPGGETLDAVDYRYYESDLRFAYGNWTWSDARRAFGMFGARVAAAYRAKAGG